MMRLYCQTGIRSIHETNIPDSVTNHIYCAWPDCSDRFQKLLPVRFREPAIWLLGTVAILWLTWRIRAGRIPPLRMGPGESALRKTLIVGLIMTPLAVLWLGVALIVASNYFLASSYAVGVAFYPFGVMLMVGVGCVTVPVVLKIYRVLGIFKEPDGV
jgi:hypothetical protein